MTPVSFQTAPYLQAMRAQPSAAQVLEQKTIDIPAADLSQLASTRTPSTPGIKAGDSFDKVLGGMIQEVNARQSIAADKMQGVLAGEGVPLHQAVIAMEEASVSFQLMVEVRNKLLESYQEIMRMQI
jgi:flagellar hook-basal body complex protein FliE